MEAAFHTVTAGIKLQHGAGMLEKNVKAETSFRLKEQGRLGLCSVDKVHQLLL